MLQKQGHNATRWPKFSKKVRESQRSDSDDSHNWDFRDNTYCSKSDPETVKIHEDQYGNELKRLQWGKTVEECEEHCRDIPGCKAYTFGVWEKGVWRMFGGHNGDTRCQLYSACAENKWTGMTLAYTKDAPIRPALVTDEPPPNFNGDDGDVGAGDPQTSFMGGQAPPPPNRPPPPTPGGDESVDLGPELQHPGRHKEPEWNGDALFKPGSEGDKQDQLAKKLMQTVAKSLDEQTDDKSSVYKAIDRADKEGKAFHELLRKQRDAAAAALGAANVMHKEVDEDTDAMEKLLHNFKTKTMGQDKIIASHPRFSPDFNENED